MMKWIFGLLVPVLLAWYGIDACVTAEIAFPSESTPDRFYGRPAVCFGVSVLGLCLLLHLYAFEDYYDDQPRWEFWLKSVSYFLLVGGLALGTRDFFWHLPDQPRHG